MKVIEYFIPLVLLSIAALLLGKGLATFDHSLELVRTTEITEGTIQRMVPYLGGRIGKENSLVYLPEVKFTTASGRSVQFQSREVRRADHFRTGDRVPVRYDPAQPEQAVIATFAALWALPLIYAAGGILLLLFGGWFLKRAMTGGEQS